MILTRLNQINGEFNKSLQWAVEHFRNGEDNLGLDSFLESIDNLNSIIEIYQCFSLANVKIIKMLPLYKKLYTYVHNKDIVGMTDLLEFSICPLAEDCSEEDKDK